MKLDVADPGYEEMRKELGLPPGTLIIVATPKRGTWSYCQEFPPTEYVIRDGVRMSAALARWLDSPWPPRRLPG